MKPAQQVILILQAHLRDVVQGTERAALAIVEHLQALKGQLDLLAEQVRLSAAHSAVLVNKGLASQHKQQEDLLNLQRATTRRRRSGEDQLQKMDGLLVSMRGVAATTLSLAKETRILAINARLEAARTGEGGRGFSVVATAVKALADESQKAALVSEQQIDTISEVLSTERALRREQEQAMEQEKAMLGRLAAELEKAQASYEEERGRLRVLLADLQERSRQVTQQLVEVIGAVQFQDITRQRLEHVTATLERLGQALSDPDSALSAEALTSSYVMEGQRQAHAEALGTRGAAAALPDVELF